MKQTIFNALYALCIIASLCTSNVYCMDADKTLFVITIQFPTSLKSVPGVRVYCAGTKLPCQIDHETNRLTFTVEAKKHRTLFDMVITALPQFESKENTIKFLKVANSRPYKLYTLELITMLRESANTSPEKIAELFNQEPTYTWRINEGKLLNNRIPDNAIIVCYDPQYVDNLIGGSAVEFPKIVIKEDIVNLVGSEKKLHDMSARLILDLLHMDTIHANVTQQVKHNYRTKTVVAMNT